ncbi:gephyrin-like molybdotransferase Glp [Zhouia amylolytica]|uniref:molybdopterin molybdotransferase MoeA n=1 Tax=Zhouia amylolytica TaxID=376730 RepID=UPI0020CD804F|nr:gephyrin-like molybdotransferase Glp [Zhouia amylolytica]MCQ0111280.1 molybdopterin molybdotransferase MoeA [Zhouia amylolytica]
MISISEAYQRVAENSEALPSVWKSVKEAVSYYLAEDVIAPIHMPPFPQSAMDGYALNIHDSKNYKVVGEMKAGDEKSFQLQPGEAVRIFTGAAVPDTANAVIMQEKVSENKDDIILLNSVSIMENIRPAGEQIQKGATALTKGTLLTPAAIGFLCSLGITKVQVHKKPGIAIVSTGDELIEPGQPLSYGKIYESNTAMLHSALNLLHFNDVEIYKVKDDYKKTLKLLESLINNYDLIIITGGISVGDYDFVGKALKELVVKELFYKVKQKPGKPLYFGKKNQSNIFALPGNPAAALSCFYIYVRTCLELQSGNKNYHLEKTVAPSVSEFIKKGDRPQFLKSILNEKTVTILEGQSSAMLQTFAVANALVYVPEEVNEINLGDTVEVILLPV